jgi:hypothetical protein
MRAAFFIAALICAGLAHADDRLGAPTRDEFRAGLATKPYDPGARVARMTAGASKVVRCMKYTEVRKLMGEPAFGNPTHRSADPAGKSAGIAWTYILSPVLTPNDQYDRMITVWFDESGRVKSLNPRGVDDVLPLRANAQQKCS